MKSLIKILIPAAVLLGSCSSDIYKDKSFFSKNNLSGQTLAILPVEVSFTGNLPKNWDADRVEREERERSLQYQEGIYEDLLFNASAKSRSRKAEVTVLDVRAVNQKLREHGISLKESSRISTAELAEVLGADMIIRSRVDNVRYMSKAAATGINVGASILEGMVNKGSTTGIYAPRAVSGESDMDISLYHASRESAVARVDGSQRLRVNKLPVYVRN